MAAAISSVKHHEWIPTQLPGFEILFFLLFFVWEEGRRVVFVFYFFQRTRRDALRGTRRFAMTKRFKV
jgi:hypothetical protein